MRSTVISTSWIRAPGQVRLQGHRTPRTPPAERPWRQRRHGPPAGGLASSLLRYPHTTTDAQLEAMPAGTRPDVATVHFVNPANGPSALPTLGLSMARLLVGGPAAPVRRAGSSIVVVFRGSGYTVMNGTRFDCGRKDTFVISSWVAAEHHPLERSDLFVTSDRPALAALGLYREEMLDEEQSVSGSFVPL